VASTRAPLRGDPKDLDVTDWNGIQSPAAAALAEASGRAHARHGDHGSAVDADGIAVAHARAAAGRQQPAHRSLRIGARGLGHGLSLSPRRA
jgi:hypothetical protein